MISRWCLSSSVTCAVCGDGDRVFGDAGAELVIEEYLEGEEVSLIGLADGTRVAFLPPARDYKR